MRRPLLLVGVLLMALSVKAGAFNIGLGAFNSTQQITIGFQAKAILFWWSGRTEDVNTAGSATSLRGFGFYGGSQRAVSGRDVDALGTANTDYQQTTFGCVCEMGDGVNAGIGSVSATDATSFTMIISAVFTTDLRVQYLAIGGSDITNTEVGSFTAAGAAPVTQTVNNTGNFQPDITFFIGTPATATTDAVGVDSTLFIGAATDSDHEAVWMGGANDASTNGATGTYCRSGESIAIHPTNPTTSPTNRAEFVSHNTGPGGFTINWLERATGFRIHYLSIKGGTWTVGDLLTKTDTVTPMSEGGFIFPPAAVLFVSGCKAETVQDATPDAHDEWSMGAATTTSGERVVQAVASRDGNTTMFTMTAVREDDVYVNFDPATDAIEGLMDVQSFGSNGFTSIMNDADPSPAFVWYVAVGAVVVQRRFLLH